MENLDNYLLLIVAFLSFFVILMLYAKYHYRHEQFEPSESAGPQLIPPAYEKNIYETEDTRQQFPALPPANPMVRKSQFIKNLPANQDLYDGPTEQTNQLVYSGGTTEMIRAPLQMNYPYNEQLRSQNILVTPYNKVKYGSC